MLPSITIKNASSKWPFTHQQVAWFVLLSAFAVFCVICFVSGVGINYFLFQSTVPMQVNLDVGRGTSSFIDSDLVEKVVPRDGHFMVLNETVSTDSQSQSVVFLRDTYRSNELIAAVTLKRSTRIRLGSATRPRFQWSSVGYRGYLTDVEGALDIYIPPNLERGVSLVIESAVGPSVWLTESGQYTVSVTGTQVQVSNWRGSAVIVSQNLSTRTLVPAGQYGVIDTLDTSQTVTLGSTPVNLLQNEQIETAIFTRRNNPEALLADLIHPWQCFDTPLGPPPGRIELSQPEGRPALRFVRGDQAETHGETFCTQPAGPGLTGRDVSTFNSLALKVTVYVENQSLPLCGIEGSECPLMVQLDYLYRDSLGIEQPGQWIHGFYVTPDPKQEYPPLCSSCLLEHERIYSGAWYTFDSGNLFNTIPPNQRPISVLRLKIYASGHQYDVHIADVALLAG